MKNVFLFLLMGAALAAQTAERQTFPPTAEQRQAIDAKLADLTSRLKALAAKKTDPALLADVDVYRKAAEYILRFPEEFGTKNYVPETLTVLDDGLSRAKELEAGTPSWTKKKGNLVRAFVSRVDGSVQPYGLTIPASYDGTKPLRLDVWLHGTQTELNEVRFIVQQQGPHNTSQIVAEDYI
ncbi:MAG: hypothetical protein ND807_03245, partial [Vicinamibacterales bacterium]|nr:hypothetical protein [Vicinamibacterales bacterium]